MSFLYNFGMSQDDAESERKALDLKPGDRLICLASAGEVPLNLLATTEAIIDAADISEPQIFLARLKMLAALYLDPPDAAQFIGYTTSTKENRQKMYRHLYPHLREQERNFWEQSQDLFEKGPILMARFEKYLSRFNGLALTVIGRKKMGGLFEFDEVGPQRDYFDRYLASKLLKIIFKVVFHPRIYKKRGMDEKGLTHSGETDIAAFFFGRFRDFCTSTIARQNYFLQFSFYNRILFPEAFPSYLQENGNMVLRNHIEHLSFFHEPVTRKILSTVPGFYNKFALSNVGDWLQLSEMSELIESITQRSAEPGLILLRYIHRAHPVPDSLKNMIHTVIGYGHELEAVDRYPFYNLVPMVFNGSRR
jgi:S-adenosylmethionine-diacylglycerol 3-amino-3-carboxypropyl transferase